MISRSNPRHARRQHNAIRPAPCGQNGAKPLSLPNFCPVAREAAIAILG